MSQFLKPAGPFGEVLFSDSHTLGGLLAVFVVSTVMMERLQGSFWEVRDQRVRIVFPTRESVDSARARILLRAVERQAALPGLRDALPGDRLVTVSLATGVGEGIDGRSYALQRLIVLPYPDVFQWSPDKLRRVIRHESAHLGLASFVRFAPLPVWFDEGYAEWAAGGLTCEGETRIRLELALRQREQREPPAVVTKPGSARTRLWYDLIGTLFEYVDRNWVGVVSDGRLLLGVKEHGVIGGFQRVLARTPAQVEEQWQRFITDTYKWLPQRPSCTIGGH